MDGTGTGTGPDAALARFAAAAALWASGKGGPGEVAALAAVSHGVPLPPPHVPADYGLDPASGLPPPGAAREQYVDVKDAARARAHAEGELHAKLILDELLLLPVVRPQPPQPGKTPSGPPTAPASAVAAVLRGASAEWDRKAQAILWRDPLGHRIPDLCDSPACAICISSARLPNNSTLQSASVSAAAASPLMHGIVAAARNAIGKKFCIAWTVPRPQLLAVGVQGFRPLVLALVHDGWRLENSNDDAQDVLWIANEDLRDETFNTILRAAADIGIDGSFSQVYCITPAGTSCETNYPRDDPAVANPFRILSWHWNRRIAGIRKFLRWRPATKLVRKRRLEWITACRGLIPSSDSSLPP